ncbi:ABC transporter permease [bacterium]|nr:ABC transporter permease [bacterium]
MLAPLNNLLRIMRYGLGTSSLLAILGVAIGAANIIALISVTDTARFQAIAMMADYGANTVFVSPYFDEENPSFQRADAFAFVPSTYLAELNKMPELDAVAGVLMLPGHVGRGTERQFGSIEGANPDYPLIRGHKAEHGRFITAQDEAEHARVCCLGYGMIEPLFGDEDPLGQEVVIKGQRFTVVGTMIEKGMMGFSSFDDRVFIPLTTCQEIYEIDGVHSIMVRVRESLDIGTVEDKIEARLRALDGLGPDEPAEFSITSMEQLTGILDSALGVFRALTAGVASVALLVAGTGIMNVMLMQVIARTREIGVRRAVGARRRDIWLQFIAEAVAQTIAGALVGSVLGVIGSVSFSLAVHWVPHITWETVLLGMGFSAAVGLIFGVYPAVYAARLKPIDCLRYE